MIDRIKEFFEDKMIRNVLKKASADIFTKNIKFEYLENRYCKNKKGVDKLLTYCIIKIAADRTPITKEQKFNSVKHLLLKNLELIMKTKSMTSVIEIQGLEAQEQFLKTKLERISTKKLMESNEYSFTSMQYKMELASKGAITPETFDFIQNQSKKISALDNRISELSEEKAKS